MPLNRTLAPVLVLLLLAGCKKPQQEARKVVAESLDAGANADATAPKSEKEKASPPSLFSVAVDGPELKLHRVPGGPVLATDASLRAVYTLSPDGVVAPLEPLSTLTVETVAQWLEMGKVVGVGDHVFLERATFAGRAGVTIESFVTNLAKNTATKVHRNGHVSSAFVWKNGTVLGYEADDASVMGPYVWGRPGHFFVVSGPAPGALPKLPAQAVSVRGEFVGYPSGRIFALAGVRAKIEGEDADPAYLWDFADGLVAKPVKMPGAVLGLVQGRDEKETLAFGNGWLSRWDGKAWVELADVPTGVSSASVADDGTVWIVATEGVWRAEAVGEHFTKAMLPGDVGAETVVARTKNDVWLSNGSILYHSQPSKTPQKLADNPDDFASAVLAQKDPPPYTRACVIPFLALGAEGEMTEAEVLAVSERMPDSLTGSPVLGRTKSGKVYGIPFMTIGGFDAQTSASLQTWAGQVRAKRPTARLVCTRPQVEKEITKPK